jgi:peptide/nickel transport system substrate-binding protein
LDALEHIMVNLTPVVPLLDGVSFFNYSTRHFTGWPTAQDPYAYPGDSNPSNGEMEQWVLHLMPVG